MPDWTDPDVTVVGGGMAGCEAAWQLAERGLRVALVEQKPQAMSPAHQTPALAELVCSNSLRSDELTTPAGLLKDELRRAGSLLIRCADDHKVPAGAALAVERFGFGRAVTACLALHPRIRIERRALDTLPPGPVIVATGPLTGGPLGALIQRELGGDRMYFYDAIAPIVAAETIDHDHAFRGSRWGRDAARTPSELMGASHATGSGARHAPPVGASQAPPIGASQATPTVDDADEAASEGDYVNCPLDRDTYVAFVEAIRAGRKIAPHAFEEPRYFDSCLPIEVMADRGLDVLRHGPMRPVGLTDPRTGRRPYAVVQLRPENRYLTSFNLVGFQTRLAYPEQQRIFSMVPALGRAEFLRFGSIHRNSYIDAPRLVGPELELRSRPALRFGGLLTGVEGYIESCAMGLLTAWFLAERLRGRALEAPPPTTMFGGLHQHVVGERIGPYRYAPTNVNFGLLPPLENGPKAKDDRKRALVSRAQADLTGWLSRVSVARAA